MNRLPAPDLPPWLDALLPLERFRLDVGRWEMHVMTQGSGMPVVMLHGNPTWGFLYRKVAEALTNDYVQVILPDLIGLGLSDKPDDPAEHTLANHAEWFGAAMDALELERFVFVGQDWGGPIGYRWLADNAERCAGLVILNTVIGEPKPGFKPTLFHRFSQLPGLSDLVFRVFDFPQRGMSLAQVDKSSISGEVARAYRWPLRGFENNVAPLALARMVPDGPDHPSLAPLRRARHFVESFDGPIEVVWGDDDPVLGGVIRHVEKRLPHANVTRCRAGHFLQEEVPVQIAEAVRRAVEAARRE